MSFEKDALYRLGDWQIFPDRNEIERKGEAVRVEPMSMRLLMLLLGNGERTTTRDQIVERLWNGRVVSDDAITKQISKLRAYLGDDPRNPVFIRTVPKVGVRLLLAPKRVTVCATTDMPVAVAATGSPVRWTALASLVAAVAALVVGYAMWNRGGLTPVPLVITERPLTSAPGLEFDPALSPDGRWLAFVASSAQGPDTALFVRPVDDDRSRRLTSKGTNPRTPAWSRGGRIAYVLVGKQSSTVMAGIPSGALRPVVARPATLGLVWLGDDRIILAAQPEFGAPFRLELIDLGTGHSTVLTTPPSGAIGDRLPAVSPDGRHVYFVRTQTVGVEHVLSTDIRSATTTPVIVERAHIVGLATTAGGRLLIATDRGRGQIGLWQFTVADRSWRQLLPSVSGGPSASADGGRIVFSRAQLELALWRQPLSGAPAQPVTQTTLADHLPVAARDGTLAFVSNRSGSLEIWRLAPDVEGPSQVTHFGGADVQDPSWSPDGRSIAVAAASDNNFDIYLVDAQSGIARRIQRTAENERHPFFSLDGHMLFFARSNGPRFDLWCRDLATGREHRVTDDALRALPSGEGQVLYFGKLLRPGLFRIPVSGRGAVEQIADGPVWGDMRDWTVAQGQVWWIKRKAGQPMLMSFDPASSRSSERMILSGLAQGSGLAISEGGAIYSRQIEAEADIIMLELRAP